MRFVVGCKFVTMLEAVHLVVVKRHALLLGVVPCARERARRSSIVVEDCTHYAA